MLMPKLLAVVALGFVLACVLGSEAGLLASAGAVAIAAVALTLLQLRREVRELRADFGGEERASLPIFFEDSSEMRRLAIASGGESDA